MIGLLKQLTSLTESKNFVAGWLHPDGDLEVFPGEYKMRSHWNDAYKKLYHSNPDIDNPSKETLEKAAEEYGRSGHIRYLENLSVSEITVQVFTKPTVDQMAFLRKKSEEVDSVWYDIDNKRSGTGFIAFKNDVKEIYRD